MERARAAAAAALFAVLVIATAALAAIAPALRSAAAPAAAVAWPASTLVVSEVQTGGASASDEFVEIANSGLDAVDLAGLEVVYVTSTGGTITRKASWTAGTPLEPGRHLLLANSVGVYASVADGLYSGGLAATGGAIVLRVVGGAPIDAVGWGDATNAFVEGAPAIAPAARSSSERRPGGIAGNTTDTNDNAADWFAQAVPNPQNLAAPPVPAPAPSATPTIEPTPSPTPTISPTETPSSTPTPSPTDTPNPSPVDSPTPVPTPSPTASPADSPTPDPTAAPSATPVVTAEPTPIDTPSPTPVPTPAETPTPAPTQTIEPTPTSTPAPTPTPAPTQTPTPTPASTPLPIVDARGLLDGQATLVEGVLTTDLGVLESAHVGFVQDGTAGIAVYLDVALASAVPAGTSVRLPGVIDERYGARTLRVTASDIVVVDVGMLPSPAIASTGAIGEALEGSRVTVTGTTVGSPTDYADGIGLLVDDGTGAVRVIVGPSAWAGASVPGGTVVTVVGVVGQRDSTGTGSSGYRVHATLPGDLIVVPGPTPTPPPTPTPSPADSPTPAPTSSSTATSTPAPVPSIDPTVGPTPTSAPTPSPTVMPTPSPSPTAVPSPSPSPMPGITIGEARSRAVGAVVTVIGTVTAEAGRLGMPPVLVIADETAGIAVRLPDGAVPPARGRLLRVTGALAAPYGQLEVRPALGGLADLGPGTLPSPLAITASQLGEPVEGRLVVIDGTQVGPARRSASGDITIDVTDPTGRAFRVMADASSGIRAADVGAGSIHRFMGIVGQRASRKGALDGYRLWLRDRADIGTQDGGPTASPTPSSSPSPGPSLRPGATEGDPSPWSSPGLATITIAAAAALDGKAAIVVGVVTGGPGLLDGDGRRIVIQDATGAIEVLLPSDGPVVAMGMRVKAAGTIGRAWGAPRLRAVEIAVLEAHVDLVPRVITGAPGSSEEWQLVRIAGTVTDVQRLGDRWRASVRVGTDSVLVTGLAGSGIASTTLDDGRAVTIVGIVRRPYPSATDRRWPVTPRGPWDIAVGPPSAGTTGGNGASPGSGGAASPAGGSTGYRAGPATGQDAPRDMDLAALDEAAGTLVRVGGLVVAATPDGFTLDDGTAVSTVILRGPAAEFRGLIHAGDAVGLVGRVERTSAGLVVAVEDPAGLVRLGSLGEVVPLGATTSDPQPTAPGGGVQTASAGLADPLNGLEEGALGLVGASAASLLVALLRRRRERGRLVAIVARRLNGLRRPPSSAGMPSGSA